VLPSNSNQFFPFVQKVFGSGKSSASGQDISIVCPFCKAKKNETYSKRKLVIRIDGLTHCWVCNYKSKNLIHLLKSTDNSRFLKEYVESFVDKNQIYQKDDDSSQEEQVSNIELPESFELLATADDSSSHVRALKKYLKTRLGDFDRDLWYWKLGYTSFDEKEYRNRIVMPSFDCNGNLNYFTARHVKGYNPKYKNPSGIKREDVVFNEINIDWTQELTLVEGPFDLVKCNDNATCVLGSSLTKEYLLFQKIVENKTPILLAFDPDALTKSLTLAKLFAEYDIQTRILEIPNSYKAKDVGDLTKKQFNELSQYARLYTRSLDLRSRLNLLV
jgi:hypothetical protein